MSERERSGERKKRSKGQNSSRVERARIPESHRPMHLYPARLGSALPASVARQSSPPFSSLSRPLLRSPSYIRFFFFFVRLASSALSRATKSLRGPSDADEEEEVEEEARSYRRRRVPVVRFFSPLFFALDRAPRNRKRSGTPGRNAFSVSDTHR